MRLIDADKLPATCNAVIVNGKLEVNGWIAAKRIEEAPTVKAIPIEWFENWKSGKTSIEQVVADKIMMDYKYRNWEKENGK